MASKLFDNEVVRNAYREAWEQYCQGGAEANKLFEASSSIRGGTLRIKLPTDYLIIDSLGHERAEYETKRTDAVERQEGEVRFFDEVKDRDHFRRVFATWDYSQFAR